MKLEDEIATRHFLKKEKVGFIDRDKVICKYADCEDKGLYARCYSHASILCPFFVDYYKWLNSEERRGLLE